MKVGKMPSGGFHGIVAKEDKPRRGIAAEGPGQRESIVSGSWDIT